LTRRTGRDSVSINVPFDKPHIPMYLGLVSGIVALGLTPTHATSSTARMRRTTSLLIGMPKAKAIC
jgi:hypothetical protein